MENATLPSKFNLPCKLHRYWHHNDTPDDFSPQTSHGGRIGTYLLGSSSDPSCSMSKSRSSRMSVLSVVVVIVIFQLPLSCCNVTSSKFVVCCKMISSKLFLCDEFVIFLLIE